MSAPGSRRYLLWQVSDLIGQLRWIKLFWAVQEPETYGGYMAQPETALDRSEVRARPWDRSELPEENRTDGRPVRSLWQCPCLRWNRQSEEKCTACGKHKSVQPQARGNG